MINSKFVTGATLNPGACDNRFTAASSFVEIKARDQAPRALSALARCRRGVAWDAAIPDRDRLIAVWPFLIEHDLFLNRFPLFGIML